MSVVGFSPSRIWYLCSLSYWLISTYKSWLKCSTIIAHQVSCRNWVPEQLQQAWTIISEKMSVTYDTYAFRVFWNVSHKFHIKIFFFYISWRFRIFPDISKFNRSMNVSKSKEIIVRRYTEWPLVRVCFIYSTINDRFP